MHAEFALLNINKITREKNANFLEKYDFRRIYVFCQNFLKYG